MRYNFWNKWKFFSEFDPSALRVTAPGTYKNKRKDRNDTYKWRKWNEVTPSSFFDDDLFGIQIESYWEPKETKDKRLNLQLNCNEMLEELDELQKKKVFEELGCPICLNLIDMTANLQCLKWRHAFCFYCLIDNLKVSSDCPCCKSPMTIDTLTTNKNLISIFNLIIDIGKSKEIIWKLHTQRWDIYWMTCKLELWCECILSNEHKLHELVSLKTLNSKTKVVWKELSNSQISSKSWIEKNLERINDNQSVLNWIMRQWISPFEDFLKKHYEDYISKLDNIHSPYITQLSNYIKSSDEDHVQINQFVKQENINDLNDVLATIDNISEVEKNNLSILDKYQQSCSKENLVYTNPPVVQFFEFCMKSLSNKKVITMNANSDKFHIKKIKLVKISSTTWGIQIVTSKESGFDRYVRVKIAEQNFFSIEERNHIFRLQKCTAGKYANKIIFNENKENKNSRITVEVNVWEITEELTLYLKNWKDSIKKGLLKLFD